MRKGFALAAILSMAIGPVHSQTQFRTPNGPNDATLSVNGCIIGGVAVPCGTDASPLMTAPASGAGSQNVAVSNFPATQAVTQSGTWRIWPRVGTPIASPTTSLGVTASDVVAASATRSWLVVQNPSMVGVTANSSGIWCRIDGSPAVAGPPSFYIAPGQTWAPGVSSGFMPTSAISCIASAAATPVAIWSVP